MATWLKQSTAIDVKVGPFLDETDGKTAETGLTITQPDIRLAKNGGAFAQKSAAQTLTHEENGWYEVALSTTDTDTLGTLILAIHESGALPVWREFMVVPAQVWDSFLSTDLLQVHAAEISNDLITAAAIANSAIDASAIASDAITAAKIADGAIDAATFAAGAINAAAIAADAITSAKIATDAIGADELADGAITSGVFAAGAITAAAIATGAIDADALATDAVDEIRDGVWAKAMTELSAVPGVTDTTLAALTWCFELARNKITQTSATQTVFKDDGSTTLAASTHSDDGTTHTRGEFA